MVHSNAAVPLLQASFEGFAISRRLQETAAILYLVQRQRKAEGAYNELCHEALKMLFL